MPLAAHSALPPPHHSTGYCTIWKENRRRPKQQTENQLYIKRLKNIHFVPADGDQFQVGRDTTKFPQIYTAANSYPNTSHVRHFDDAAAVVARYAPYFDDYSVPSVVRDERGHILYIMEGIKRPNPA